MCILSCDKVMNRNSSDTLNSDEECIPLLQRIRRKMKKVEQPTELKSELKFSQFDAESGSSCSICATPLPTSSTVSCLNRNCKGHFHIICLSRHFMCHTNKHQILPVEGTCPCCKTDLLWGDLIRESQGFHQYLKQDS